MMVNGNTFGMKISLRQRQQGRPCRSRGGLETLNKTSMRLASLIESGSHAGVLLECYNIICLHVCPSVCLSVHLSMTLCI